MSNGNQGASRDLVGAGSIVITPAATTKIFPSQGLCLVATITMSGSNKIPAGATIDFTGSGKGSSLYFTYLFGEPDWTNVGIDIDVGSSTGTARLYIRHYDPQHVSNTIVVNARAGTEWVGAPKPDDAATVTYTVASSDPTIICSGPSKTLIGVPTAAEGDELTPAADSYMTSFSCTVMDGATPVPGYVVEWHEGADPGFGLFAQDNLGLVNAYTSATAAYGDAIPTQDALLIEDESQQSHFVRMVTDASGSAGLYLVAKSSTGAIASSVVARYGSGVSFEYPRPFLAADLSQPTPALSNLYAELQDPTETGNPDTIDFTSLLNPPNMTVRVPAYSSSDPKDNVYVVLNNAIVAGPYHYAKENPTAIDCQFPASLAYSETTSSQQNQILFVIGENETGIPSVSAPQGFYGAGDNIQLQGGALQAPTLYPTSGHINQTSLGKGFVTIQVQLNQPDYVWTAKAGDAISATAVLTGYRPNSDALRAPVSVTANALPPVTEDDLRKGFVLLNFPAAPFKGWDRQKDGKRYDGHACFIYKVVRAHSANNTSALLHVILNTANLSD